MDKHIVIIGAGLGGLACGARLAVLGYRVTVLEKHIVVGGYASHFQRKGYRFDVSLHGLGGMDEGGMLHNILEKCDVLSRIQPVRKKLSYSVKLNGRILDIPQETRHYQELLEEVFPFERNEIRQLFADLAQMSRDIRSKTLDSPLLKKWLRMSTFDALRSYPLSKEFIDLFCAKWIYYGLPPSRLSALYFFIPWISYHMEGTYYLRGGSQTLSDAFAETIRRNGGEIRLRSQVVKILTGEKKVTGVVLKNGDVLSCDWIVSNANPILTFNKLLPPEEPIESYRSKLKKMEIGSSLFQLYLGLSCDPQKIGFNREDCYFMDEPDTDRDYQHSVNKDYEKVNINVTNYSAIDPLLQGKNRGVLAVTGVDFMKNWPEDRREYRKQKQRVIQILLKRLENHIPGITDVIDVLELATPRTMFRYTWNHEGAVYGFAQTVSQSNMFRLSSKTPYKNLSLVGAWTRPGGGFQGAIVSGYQEAERLSKIFHPHFIATSSEGSGF
mgnify:CR=1 FL=1